MGPLHEGSIRRPIAPWANALTTDLHLALVNKGCGTCSPVCGMVNIKDSRLLMRKILYFSMDRPNCTKLPSLKCAHIYFLALSYGTFQLLRQWPCTQAGGVCCQIPHVSISNPCDFHQLFFSLTTCQQPRPLLQITSMLSIVGHVSNTLPPATDSGQTAPTPLYLPVQVVPPLLHPFFFCPRQKNQ